MAARKESLKVELTATDKLSKVVDRAAKAVDDLDGEKAEVEVTADAEQAEQAIETVDKLVDELDSATAEATLSAEDQAKDEIDEVMRRLQDLDDEEVVAVLSAKATKLEAEIKNANALLAKFDGEDATAIITAKDHASAQLREVNGRLGDLQGGFKHVTTEGTQSRSVLANLAGNSAQDIGELGGVVGSLGVGVGQLAEYAVDGNIKMNELAKVAGPMAGLAVAGMLVQKHFEKIAKIKAFETEQVEAYRKAIAELGPTADAVRQKLEEMGRVEISLGDNFGTVDITRDLVEFGITVDDVAQVVEGGGGAVDEFRQKLIDGGASADEADQLIAILGAEMDVFNASAEEAALQAEFFALSQDSANTALAEFNKQNNATEDPRFLRLFKDMNFDGTINNLGLLQTLMDEYGVSADEAFEMAVTAAEEAAGGFEKASGAADGLTRAFSAAKTPAGDYSAALENAKSAAQEHAQAIRDDEIAALEAEQAALEDSISQLEEYIGAQRDAYDTQIDYREATEDAEDALTDYNNALTETDDETGELVATQEEINDLGEDFVQSVLDQSDALIDQNAAQAAANRTTYSGTQAINDQNAALLNTAHTIPQELLPQFAEMITQINGIPEAKETILTMLREGEDPAVILEYLNGISGTYEAAVEVEADQQAIASVAGQLAQLAKPIHVQVYTHHQASNDQGHRAAGGPVSAGSVYTVGERGQELFVPDQDGTIIPAGQTAALLSASQAGRHLMPAVAAGGSGGGDAYYDVNINMPPGSNGQDVYNALQRFQRTNGPLRLRIAG